jgi:hypothetical protein
MAEMIRAHVRQLCPCHWALARIDADDVATRGNCAGRSVTASADPQLPIPVSIRLTLISDGRARCSAPQVISALGASIDNLLPEVVGPRVALRVGVAGFAPGKNDCCEECHRRGKLHRRFPFSSRPVVLDRFGTRGRLSSSYLYDSLSRRSNHLFVLNLFEAPANAASGMLCARKQCLWPATIPVRSGVKKAGR